MEGTTYPEHLAPGVSLDSGLKAGMSNLEPLPPSVLKMSFARPQVEIRTSHWKPVINPVRDINQNGLPMEWTAYLEHLALGVSLDSGPTEGASCLEPLEQWIFSLSLAARPVESVVENVSDRKPVINPVISYTLDSRLMEGITCLERSAPRVSLDSGPTEGASCLEPLEQWGFSPSLAAARPVEGVAVKESDHKPVLNPVQDITPDGRPMEEINYPKHLAPGVSLDSGLKAGMSNTEPLPLSVLKTSLAAQPQVEIRTSHWKPVINLVRDINQNGLPMEGTAYSEHPALGVSLDSRLMNELLRPEPSQQSVLGALLAIWTNETDRPKRPALALQWHHKQLCFQLTAWPMSVPDIVNHTDINDDINIDLPESSAPMIKSPTVHRCSCFISSAWPRLKSFKRMSTLTWRQTCQRIQLR